MAGGEPSRLRLGDVMHIALKPWLALLYVALFSQWIGFFAWNAGMAMGGIARVSQVQLLQPFVTFALAAFFVKSDTNTPAQKEFVAKLEDRAQKELNETHDVTYWDVASYDAVRLVADAIKRGGPQATSYLALSLAAMASSGIPPGFNILTGAIYEKDKAPIYDKIMSTK